MLDLYVDKVDLEIANKVRLEPYFNVYTSGISRIDIPDLDAYAPDGRSRPISVFADSKIKCVLWKYIELDSADPVTGHPPYVRQFMIPIDYADIDFGNTTSIIIEDLYQTLLREEIVEGDILSGAVVQGSVVPYSIGGARLVDTYTTPVLWPEAYPNNETKVATIRRFFAMRDMTFKSDYKETK